MYCEDGEITPDLNTSLPVTSCTPLNDSATIPEFTGSTINLQDLEWGHDRKKCFMLA